MYQKFDNLSIFNNSSVIYKRKPNSIITSWISILLVATLLFCLIAFFYKYSISNIYYAKVINTEDENYITINVDQDFISMKNRNYLKIGDDEYKCHLISSSDNYYIMNSKKYWQVNYDCDLPDELNINDSLIEVHIEMRETTLFKELIRKIRKEIKNGRLKN